MAMCIVRGVIRSVTILEIETKLMINSIIKLVNLLTMNLINFMKEL